MNDDYLTTTQAAELAGVGHTAIRMAIYRGYLPAGKFGPVYMIRRADLDAYLTGRTRNRDDHGRFMPKEQPPAVHDNSDTAVISTTGTPNRSAAIRQAHRLANQHQQEVAVIAFPHNGRLRYIHEMADGPTPNDPKITVYIAEPTPAEKEQTP
jgi:excisionase family DNA binding protein